MCEHEPFKVPTLHDEVVVTISNFPEELYTRFQDHNLAQMHRYHHDLREHTDKLRC